MLRSLKTTGLNYQIAWESLTKRYDNTRRIVDTHVKEIVHLPKVTNNSRDFHEHLRKFINTVRNQVKCLQALGQPVDQWDAILVPILLQKLDDNFVSDWESKLNARAANSEIPTLESFIDFLDKKEATLEATANLHSKRSEYKTHRPQEKPKFHTRALVMSIATAICANCGGNHYIQYCQSFLDLKPKERGEKVKALKICTNCLRKGHAFNECRSSSCKICGKRHNTVLHITGDDVQKEKQKVESNSTVSCSSITNRSASAQSLLPTAAVDVYDSHGNAHTLRVLLDSASQSNFITSETVKKLNLKTQPANLILSGISKRIANVTQRTKLDINSKINNFKATVECLVLDNITGNLPNTKIESSDLDIPPNLKISDTKFCQPGEIQMLIGVELFWQILCVGQIRNKTGTVFQKTKLGWVISGRVDRNAFDTVANFTQTFLTINMLDRNLERFWKVDEIGEGKNFLTAEERYCESHFTQTTTRADDGKFEVRIPMKPNIHALGDSRDVAESRFRALERKFSRNDSFKKQYSDCIKDYQTQGHMSQVQTQDTDRFFLPHHAVIKESSETTKLRVVFDGSCQLNSGLPVNQVQCVGPTIQEDIFDIISRFRTHKYVFTADIAQMYRQIWVSPEDRKFQTILWRNHCDEPMRSFELNTVTFGMGASPFLAIRCLFEIANLNEAQYPEEAAIIKRDFYVDDCLTGSSSIETLKTRKENLNNILGQAGFVLRKWRSNVAEINELNINQDPLSLFDSDSLDLTKTLGIFWKPETDTFVYRVDLRGCNKSITKRTILSMTAQLFDPIGFLSPVIIVAKLIIQELWQLQLHWDEAIPSDISYCWLKFRDELKHVSNLAIPRFILTSEYETIEIHGFSDASEKAYGACTYIKSVNSEGEIVVRLVAAKSRVAPLKVVSLPRLELLAAVLLAELVNKIKIALNLKFAREFYWCDSRIVLGWLGAPPGKWTTFVANRVAVIQELTDQGKWRHVRTQENPADVISRGTSPLQLIQHDLWWYGPSFLRECQDDGVTDTAEIPNDIVLPEAKKPSKVLVSVTIAPFPTENFSNLTKLKKIAALCLRFIRNCRLPKTQRTVGPISVQEQNEALLKLIKIVQIKSFPKEYENLQKKKPINPTSTILGFAPFLDANGLIRVGGRLKKSRFEFDKKHPIVLPKGESISKLIFEEKHIETCHGGPTMLLNVVRERFWPISGKNLAKGVVRNCVKCCRFNAKVSNPLMGDLPENRVTPMPPFYASGVDYAGPFLLKDRPGRGTCNCDPQGSQFPTCEQHSGQCLCKSHFTGLKCDRCEEGYWKDGEECVPCLCDDEGALSQSCDQQTGVCFCKAGVAPPTCTACLPNHYGNIIEGCKECDVCDKEGYICHPESGKCVCPPLTMGLKCEKCIQNAWGNPGIGCKACECSHSGSSKLQCDKKTGRCTCKPGFEGEKCDRCSYGYYGYKHCKKCNCDAAGTIPEDCSLDSCRCTEDGCRCKANVRGKYCDTCKEGTFGVDLKNTLGCTECFCFGRSRKCFSAGYSWEQIKTDQVVQDTCINNAPCWTLPSKFTGDLTSTYGGFLRVTSNSALPSNYRIYLTGNGITIGARVPEPEVMMVENNWRVIQDTVPPKLPQECASFPTRACLLAIYQNVTKIQIEIGPSFRTTDFTEVVLDKAIDSQGISRASTVEGCECPKEYTGLSCQDPNVGYYRYYPKELETNNYIDRIIGIARRCHCNNKSNVCDRQTGHCQNCNNHTTGPHCELCTTGYYKDTSGKCLPCLCPTDKLNFADSCEPEPGNQPSQFVCNCLPGYTGTKCDRCEGTYFGSPWKDGFCQPCDCNPYGSESQVCDGATGACVCKPGFTGRTCSQCVSPREVIQNGVCTPCDECTQILFDTLDNLSLGLNKTLDLFKDGLGPPWPVLHLTLSRYKLFSSKFDSDLNKAHDLIKNAHLDELEEKVSTLNSYLNLKKQKADQQIKAIKGLQADSEDISKEAVILQDKINEIIKNLNDFGQSHINTQDALKEARTLLKDINEKSSLVPRPEEYEDLFKKCDDLAKEINEVFKGENNPDEIKSSLSALKKRMGALNSLLDQTEVMNKLAKNKNKRNTARIAKLNGTINDINTRNYAVNGELTDLVGLINATTNLLEDIEKLHKILSGIDIEGATKKLEGDSDNVPELYDLLENVGDHVRDLQDKIKTYKSMFNFTSEEWKKINASGAYEHLVKGIEEARNSANEAQDIVTEALKILTGEPGDDTLPDRASIAQGLSDRLKQRILNLKNPTDDFRKIRDDLEKLKYDILKNGRNNNDLTTILHNMRQQIKKQSEHVDDLEKVKEEAGNVSDRMANIEKEVKNLNITTQYDLIKTYHKYLNLTSGNEISKLQDKVTLARMELEDLHINFTHIDIIKKINDEKFRNTNANLDSIEAKINMLKNKIQYAKQAADSINIAMDLTNCARQYRIAPDVFKTVTLTFKCKTCNLFNLTNSKGQFLTINVINKDIVVGIKWKHQDTTKIETKTLKGGDNTTTIQIEKIGSIMELRTEQGGTAIDSATVPIGKELFKIGGDDEHYLQVGKTENQEEACLQKLVLNDQMIGLWNFVTSSGNCPGCQKDTSIAGSKILFGGNGYRNVTGARSVKPDMVDLQFYFTTFDENSLLFLAQDKENHCSYVSLSLINGHLELRVRHIDGTEVFLKSKRTYNNGIETRIDVALLYRNGMASYSLSVEAPNSEPDKVTDTKKLDRASVFKIRKSEIFLGGLPGTFDKHCIPVTTVPFLGYLRSGNAEYNDPVRTTAYDTKLQSGELRFTKAWFSGNGFLNLGGLGEEPSQDYTSLSFLLRQPSPNGFVMNFGDMLDIYLKNEKLIMKINENPIMIEPALYKDINYIEIEINKGEVTVSVNDNPPTSIGKIKISKRDLQIHLGKDKDGKEHPNYVGGISNIVLNNKTIYFDVGTVKGFSKVEIGREKPLPQRKVANKDAFGSIFEPHSIREMQNTEGCAIVTNYETDPDAVKLGDKKDSYIFIENSFWRRDYVLELQFRTFYPNGLLFLSVGAHQQKQFNLLEIKEGKVQLKMKGKKLKVLTMPDKVNDGVWHYVQIKQSGVKKKRKLTISLDGVSKKPVRMPKSNVKGELYVGGVPEAFIDYIEIKNQMHSFRGCMKSLKINNVLQVLVKNKKNVSYNNIGQCFPRVERGAYFSGDSYAIYKGDFKVNKILELSLEFRTPEQNGILLSVSNFGNSPALSVELQNGAVVMTIDMGNGAVFNVTNSLESEFTLCNNKWHNITALYSSSELTVNVDGIRKTWVQLDVNSLMDEIEAPLYVGGLPDNAPSGTLKTKENFKGCIRKLKIEDRLMDWTDMKELSNVLLHSCPVIT